MEPDDEAELTRLGEALRRVDAQLKFDPSAREALQKAGIALTIAFTLGKRKEVEDWHRDIGTPLSEAQRAHLRRLGIDPGNDG
jgi:hypothetical protein